VLQAKPLPAMMEPMRSLSLAAALLAAFPLPAAAQPAPMAAPIAPNVPEPADTPYPGGVITLDIDATDTLRGVYRVTETIPLAPGTTALTLLFPEWLPGHHAPRGPIAELVDLRLTADGRPAAWERDPIDVHAFHVTVPAGARALTATFLHTSPLQTSEGRITMTQEMLNLQWEKMSLYPAGHYVRRIKVKPAVTLPRGWTAAAALDGGRVSGNRLSWAETDYETLVDSPIFAGVYSHEWDLGNAVTLHAVADAPELLLLDPRRLTAFKALVDEALLTFGRPPFDRYELLVALTDRMGGIGLEHLRSSENQLEPRNFVDWDAFDWDRNVLAHEFTHAWNGKFRRPAGLSTPDYRQPMQSNLLWVYEGQTQFWGWVLAARSGLQAKQTVLGMIASQAGQYADQPGRAWRSVEDTTLDPVIAARKPKPYASLARSEDYYNEGALIWLEADQIIRAGSGRRKGLDDFARAFFAYRGDGSRQATYDFGDVVAALDAVYPYDWAAFLRRRIGQPGQPAPLAGIEQSGYRLVWKAEPNPYDMARMGQRQALGLEFSLGLSLDKDGAVTGARWGSPAFNAGIVTGATIVAVDSLAYSAEVIKQAITRAKGTSRPIELLVRRGERYLTVPVAYAGGLRWPWLERAPGRAEAPLDRLLSPRRNSMAQ
jgi:predicted metalloprotease with PDZ domain